MSKNDKQRQRQQQKKRERKRQRRAGKPRPGRRSNDYDPMFAEELDLEGLFNELFLAPEPPPEDMLRSLLAQNLRHPGWKLFVEASRFFRDTHPLESTPEAITAVIERCKQRRLKDYIAFLRDIAIAQQEHLLPEMGVRITTTVWPFSTRGESPSQISDAARLSYMLTLVSRSGVPKTVIKFVVNYREWTEHWEAGTRDLKRILVELLSRKALRQDDRILAELDDWLNRHGHKGCPFDRGLNHLLRQVFLHRGIQHIGEVFIRNYPMIAERVFDLEHIHSLAIHSPETADIEKDPETWYRTMTALLSTPDRMQPADRLRARIVQIRSLKALTASIPNEISTEHNVQLVARFKDAFAGLIEEAPPERMSELEDRLVTLYIDAMTSSHTFKASLEISQELLAKRPADFSLHMLCMLGRILLRKTWQPSVLPDEALRQPNVTLFLHALAFAGDVDKQKLVKAIFNKLHPKDQISLLKDSCNLLAWGGYHLDDESEDDLLPEILETYFEPTSVIMQALLQKTLVDGEAVVFAILALVCSPKSTPILLSSDHLSLAIGSARNFPWHNEFLASRKAKYYQYILHQVFQQSAPDLWLQRWLAAIDDALFSQTERDLCALIHERKHLDKFGLSDETVVQLRQRASNRKLLNLLRSGLGESATARDFWTSIDKER